MKYRHSEHDDAYYAHQELGRALEKARAAAAKYQDEMIQAAAGDILDKVERVDDPELQVEVVQVLSELVADLQRAKSALKVE